jgi:hypothetical protein
MKLIITESQLALIQESSYNGLFEGDSIRVASFHRRKMPRAVEKNVLAAISKKVPGNATAFKLRAGEYNDLEINLFGQLLAFLKGDY